MHLTIIKLIHNCSYVTANTLCWAELFFLLCKRWKVKFTLEHATKAQWALVGGGWSTPRSGRFTAWKETLHPSYRGLDGSHGRSGRVRKIWPPPGFDPWTSSSESLFRHLSCRNMFSIRCIFDVVYSTNCFILTLSGGGGSIGCVCFVIRR